MRNKIFISIFCTFIIVVMFSAPIKLVLTQAGILEKENVGNIIEVEKVYEEGSFGASFFNAIEEAKRDINDTYTNYLPFYVKITSLAENFKQNINQPVASLLLEWGNQIMGEHLDGTVAKDEGEEVNEQTEVVEDKNTESTQTNVGNKPETNTPIKDDNNSGVKDSPSEPVYDVCYLKSDGLHRYYEITAQNGGSTPFVDLLIRVPARDSSSLRSTMESQAKKINDFASRRPNVNWYVFPVTCFEDTKLCDRLLPAESKHSLFTNFFARLDSNVQYSYIDIPNIETKYKLFYSTDHHWNAYGYTEGYRLIVDMMRKNYPDMVARKPAYYTFDNEVEMYGSNALAVAIYDLVDFFHAVDFSLPKHELVVERGVPYGGTESIEQTLNRYQNDGYNTQPSYNHYINFYRIATEITYPGNNTGRNLLIIGDSYSPPLLEVLASHFDKTYVRYVDSNSSLSRANYEELIDKYGITDVLLLEMSDRAIYDYYSDSFKNLY